MSMRRIINAIEAAQTSREAISEDVWHGSRHRIEQFSTDFIGDGLGEQGFGWGIYFSSRQEIATHYRNRLTHEFSYRGRKVKSDSVLSSILYYVTNMGKEQAINMWREGSKQREATQKIDPTQIRVKGHVYRVKIPEENEYLLWEQPYGEQSSLVQKVMTKLLPDSQDMTGEQFYKALSGPYSDKEASLSLLANGVHGIKYHDSYSVDGNSGYNYVLFDGANVSITNKS